MIDTIILKIPVVVSKPLTIKQLLKKYSIQYLKVNNITSVKVIDKTNAFFTIGSYDSKLSVFYDDTYPDSVLVQYSVPKIVYGHNIYLCTIKDLFDSFVQVEEILVKIFGSCQPQNTWELIRLDICYAWRFSDDDYASRFIHYLNAFKLPRKKTQSFDTSVMQIGATYSTKFYLKRPEYLKHDFLRLRNINPDLAYHIDYISQGVLRFECTLRRKALQYHLKSDILGLSLITEEKIQELLKYFFYKYFLSMPPKFMQSLHVLERLEKKFGTERAKSAYYFYLAYTSPNTQDMYIFKKLHHRTSITRYKKMLKDIQVGLLNGFDVHIDFDIPSKNVVN